MLRNVYQSGILSILNSASTQPLGLWRTAVDSQRPSPSGIAGSECTSAIATRKDGQLDGADILELRSPSVRGTYISCPKSLSETLGIKLNYLVFALKQVDQLFSVEIETVDDKALVRRFRASNFESEAHVDNDVCRLPLRLPDEGWNYLTLDLADITDRAYGTAHRETRRVTIHANVQLRFVFFADRIVPEEQLPDELKLYTK
ncbi:hypothetical protein GGI12_005698 [Dipsacomyces acuminosporus]|nr:hypothetical protein GGI12_005698 [Dipsacomyces acuminosporus]